MIAKVDGTLKVNGKVYKKFDDTDEMERRAREMLEEKIKEGYRVAEEETEEEAQRKRDLTTLRGASPDFLRNPAVKKGLGYLYPELGLTQFLA